MAQTIPELDPATLADMLRSTPPVSEKLSPG